MENKKDQLTVQMAIIISGILISGSILLGFSWIRDNQAQKEDTLKNAQIDNFKIKPVSLEDRMSGNPKAKVSIIEYADFQCPFCGKFFKEVKQDMTEKYIKTGEVNFVYRDFAFLGDESIKSAEASRCAGEQDTNKFWQYHDYLFTHQKGENKGAFSDNNLKSFAKIMGLDIDKFNQCLDSGKYTKAIMDSTTEGGNAGVQGTPKGFILRNGKIVDTIDGAEPRNIVFSKIDKALK